MESQVKTKKKWTIGTPGMNLTKEEWITADKKVINNLNGQIKVVERIDLSTGEDPKLDLGLGVEQAAISQMLWNYMRRTWVKMRINSCFKMSNNLFE